MLQIKEYVRAASLEEAYQLNQKRNNVVIGGMHWLKMGTRSVGTAIDLSGLGLDRIVETVDCFEIGAMVSLRQLERHEGLLTYTMGAVRDAVKDIVGVQFRNTATVGGSIYGRYGFSDVLTVFLAMDTRVVCYQAGEMSLEAFASAKPDRDIIVKLIVKKRPLKIAYQAQRHAKTDFPQLTCGVSCLDGVWRAAVGARPGRAVLTVDEAGVLADTEDLEGAATAFGEAIAAALKYDSNMRGSGEYRQMITPVLVRRAAVAAAGEEAHHGIEV